MKTYLKLICEIIHTQKNNLQQEVAESIKVETIHEGNSKRKRYDGYGHINYSGRVLQK